MCRTPYHVASSGINWANFHIGPILSLVFILAKNYRGAVCVLFRYIFPLDPLYSDYLNFDLRLVDLLCSICPNIIFSSRCDGC